MVKLVSGYACHQLLQGALTVVLVHEQHLLYGMLLKAHLIELGQEVQKLLSLRERRRGRGRGEKKKGGDRGWERRREGRRSEERRGEEKSGEKGVERRGE